MESKDIERRFRSGEVIVERGSLGSALFIVREGAVLLEESQSGVPRLLDPGDAFGEAAAILGRPHSVRAQAEGDVVVLALDAALLNQLCARSPEFSVRLLRQLAERAERPARSPELEGPSLPLPAGQAAPKPMPPEQPAHAPRGDSERSFAAALLRCTRGEDLPLPVQGRLADLAREAGLEIFDAYTVLQRLLDRQLLRLVDDQLSILEVAQLRELAR